MSSQDAQPGEVGFDTWRNLSLQQAQELTATPGWTKIRDDYGRNAVMNGLYCFSPPPVLRHFLNEAMHQDMLADLCLAEDFAGVRLPAYALREGLRGFAHGQQWGKAIFQQGVRNSKGEGLLAQMATRNQLDNPEVERGSFTLRGIGFGFADLDHLSAEDWQAGLDMDRFVQAWGKQVMINDVSMGVSYTLDMEAFNEWLLPLFRTTDRHLWNPALADCLCLVDAAQDLIALPDDQEGRQEAFRIVREVSSGLRLLLPHAPTRRRPLVSYILSYRGWGDAWEGFLSQEQANLLAQHTAQSCASVDPRRI